MRIAATKPLFAWDCLEDSPSLATIKALLVAIPDGPLLDGLRQARGRGRNDLVATAVARYRRLRSLPMVAGSGDGKDRKAGSRVEH